MKLFSRVFNRKNIIKENELTWQRGSVVRSKSYNPKENGNLQNIYKKYSDNSIERKNNKNIYYQNQRGNNRNKNLNILPLKENGKNAYIKKMNRSEFIVKKKNFDNMPENSIIHIENGRKSINFKRRSLLDKKSSFDRYSNGNKLDSYFELKKDIKKKMIHPLVKKKNLYKTDIWEIKNKNIFNNKYKFENSNLLNNGEVLNNNDNFENPQKFTSKITGVKNKSKRSFRKSHNSQIFEGINNIGVTNASRRSHSKIRNKKLKKNKSAIHLKKKKNMHLIKENLKSKKDKTLFSKNENDLIKLLNQRKTELNRLNFITKNNEEFIAKKNIIFYQKKINFLKKDNFNKERELQIIKEEFLKKRIDLKNLEHKINSNIVDSNKLKQKTAWNNRLILLKEKNNFAKSKLNQENKIEYEEMKKMSEENLKKEFRAAKLNVENFDDDLIQYLHYYINKS